MESQIKKDIMEAEERRRGLLTQSILNPGGQVIPPLTQASCRELLTPSPLPLPTSLPPTETPEEPLETRRTLIPLSILTGSEEIEFEGETSPSTLKKPKLDTLNTSSTSAEELDPFQRLLTALKNSPRSTKQPQIEGMSKDKKPLESRLKVELPAEEAVISATVLVQMDAKKFLREVLLYIALNPKAFTTDRLKKLFLLSYMTDGPGEFWKNDKTDLLLAFDPEAEKVSWIDFIEDFKTSFEPLDTALEAQLKLQDLKIKERADEYTYQFAYLAKQTRYNDAAQIVAFKRGLPKSLALKIMTRPEGAPTNIKDWMNVAILFDESYKQAMEYGKTWDDDNGRKPKQSFRKKEEVAIKQISETDQKEYMKDEKRKEEPKKLTREEQYAKIKALVNDQPEEEKNLLIDLMELEGF
ncbi:hypothetical protein WG66_000929 [Moniliophthora roreri]|nr:hypothetical protein WG66_000929 [Moniliophthora roreri]